MTNARRTPEDLLALWHRCDYCLAESGIWCVVARGRTTGTPAVWLHADRLWPTQSAHSLAMTDSRAWTLGEVIREIDTAGERWSDLPKPFTVPDLLALLEKRLETAREWHGRTVERILDEVPREWR